MGKSKQKINSMSFKQFIELNTKQKVSKESLKKSFKDAERKALEELKG